MRSDLARELTQLRQRLGAGFIMGRSLIDDASAVIAFVDPPGLLPLGLVMVRTDFEERAPETLDVLGHDPLLPTSLALALGQEFRHRIGVRTELGGVLVGWATPDETDARDQALARELPVIRALHAALVTDRQARLEATHLAGLLDAVEQAIVGVDARGARAHVNAAASALLGLPSGVVSASELARAMSEIQARAEPDTDVADVAELLRRDSDVAVGGWLWRFPDEGRVLRVSSRPVRPDQDAGRVWTFEDVSALVDRIAQEHELAEYRARFERSMQMSAVGMALVSRSGAFLQVNDAMCAFFGRSREDLMQLDFTQVSHPEEAGTDREQFRRLVSGELDHYRRTKRYLRMDGSSVWGDITVSGVRGADGDVLYLIGQLVDVHEVTVGQQRLLNEQAKLRATLDSMLDAHLVMRAVRDEEGAIVDFTYTDANRAACEYLGIHYDELIGRSPLEFSPQAREETLPLYARALETRQPIMVDDLALSGRFSSGIRVFDLRVVPTVADSVSVTWRDVTKSHHERQELRAARTAAESASRAKAQFLANMSHEIRTPLTAVLALLQMLADTPLDEQQDGYLRRAHSSATFLLAVLNDILDYSRVEAQSLQLHEEPFALRSMLAGVFDVLQASVHGKPVRLTLDVDDGIPQMVIADEMRVRQVLLNLCGNAVKFTEQGEVRLSVRLLDRVDDRVRIEFGVRDTGIGMNRDVLHRIFEGFTQADASTARTHGGSGLGLAIARGIIEAMGSSIRVESQPGRGSDFHFTLELRESAAPIPDAPTGLLAPGHEPRLQGIRVLLVEDNAINREVVAEMLGREGAEVMLATNGVQAVAFSAAHASAIDIVLMDVQMPLMDGLEAARRMGADDRTFGLPVVAMTANVGTAERVAVDEAGMLDYIRKPFDREALVSTIRRWARPHQVALTSPILDLHGAAERVGASDAFLQRLLMRFTESLPPVVEQVRTAFAADDRPRLRSAAHALRGSAGMVGAVLLSEVAGRIEEMAAGDDSRALAGREDFEAALAATVAELHRYQ